MGIPDENSNLAYLCFDRSVWQPVKPCYDWYVLDTQKLTLEKHEKMSDCNLLLYFGCAVLNSTKSKTKIYVVGGQRLSETCHYETYPPENEVQFFDTISQKWQLGVPMNGARSVPAVVPLNNKLYVFGGVLTDKTSPWAEYFDGDKWIPIQNGPSQFSKVKYTSYGTAVYGTNNILLWNQCWFSIFDASTNQWIQVVQTPDPFGFGFNSNVQLYSTKVAVINDIMFWYFGDFFAYDLRNNKGYEDPVYSFPEIIKIKPLFKICKKDFNSPILFTTGNENDQLCLVWCEEPPFDFSLFSEYTDETIKYVENTTLQVYRLNFQVERIPNQSSDQKIVLNPIQKEPVVSTIKGLSLQAFAGIYWQNCGKGIRDCHGADPPQISSSLTLLDQLPQTMHDLNFWQLETDEITNYGLS